MPQPTTLRSQLVRHAAALAFASLGIAAAPAAHAGTISLLTSGNYDTGANWQGGTVPGLTDTAIINGLIATKNGGTLAPAKVTLDGHGSLRFSGNSTVNTNVNFASGYEYLQLDGSGTGTALTIASGAILSGNLYHVGDDYVGGGKVSVINNGTMRKDDANPSQAANLYNVTNNGAIVALNGSTLNFLGSSTNNGTLNVTNSILNASLLTGTGATNMNNSTFGGNVEASGGQVIAMTTGSKLSGTTLTIDKGASVIGNSVVIDGHGFLRFSGDNTLTTNVNFASGYDYLQLDASGTAGTTLTIASGATLSGNMYNVGSNYVNGAPNTGTAIINNGTISKNDANPSQAANLYNVLNNGTINASNGSTLNFIDYNGPTKNNGVINVTNSILNVATLSGTGTTNMNNATFGGNTEIASGQTLNAANGLTLNGQILTIDKGATLSANSLTLTGHASLYYSGDATLNTNVNFGSGYDYLQLDASGTAGTTLTIASGATLSGNMYNVGSNYVNGAPNTGTAIINNGTISKNDANPSQAANLYNVLNNGTINASNGSTLNFIDYNGPTKNNGVINVTNSILNVATLSGTGTTNMNNATFGGNTEIASGQTLNAANGLTLNGQILTIDKGATLSANSLTLTGHASLYYSGDATLNTNVNFGSGYDYMQLNASGAGTTLTIAKGVSLTGNLYDVGANYVNGAPNTGAAVINNGTISKDELSPSQPANLYNVLNNGTINALNGSTMNYIDYTGSTKNNGVINITGSILNAPSLSGTGATNMNNSTFGGNVEASGGQIINMTNGSKLNGTILTIDKGASVTGDSAKLDGHAHLYYSGNNTLNTSVNFASAYDYLYLDASGTGTTLTIAKGAGLTGNLYQVGNNYVNGAPNTGTAIINNGTITKTDASQSASLVNVTNNGTIQASNAGTINLIDYNGATKNTGNLIADKGTTIDASNAGIAQTAGKTTVNGTLNLGAQTLALTGGILSGNGTINANSGTLAVNNTGGTVSLADGKGNLSVNGNYTQTATGKFLAALGGSVAGVDFNQLFVSGSANLSGQLQIALLNGYTPSVGQTFDFIKAGSLTGDFTSITSATPGYSFSYSGNGGTGTLRVTGAAAVPESGAGLLVLLAGTSTLGFAAFRKRKAA